MFLSIPATTDKTWIGKHSSMNSKESTLYYFFSSVSWAGRHRKLFLNKTEGLTSLFDLGRFIIGSVDSGCSVSYVKLSPGKKPEALIRWPKEDRCGTAAEPPPVANPEGGGRTWAEGTWLSDRKLQGEGWLELTSEHRAGSRTNLHTKGWILFSRVSWGYFRVPGCGSLPFIENKHNQKLLWSVYNSNCYTNNGLNGYMWCEGFARNDETQQNYPATLQSTTTLQSFI